LKYNPELNVLLVSLSEKSVQWYLKMIAYFGSTIRWRNIFTASINYRIDSIPTINLNKNKKTKYPSLSIVWSIWVFLDTIAFLAHFMPILINLSISNYLCYLKRSRLQEVVVIINRNLNHFYGMYGIQIRHHLFNFHRRMPEFVLTQM